MLGSHWQFIGRVRVLSTTLLNVAVSIKNDIVLCYTSMFFYLFSDDVVRVKHVVRNWVNKVVGNLFVELVFQNL